MLNPFPNRANVAVWSYVTSTLANASEISRRVGGSTLSIRVLTPMASRSSISFKSTGGTESSVARIVSRNIYDKSQLWYV
jgi:hypothetical protein